MTIYIKSPSVPNLADFKPSQIAGRFGAFPAGEMETIDDMDTAPVGLYVVRKGGEPGYTKGTQNIPPEAQPYGTVMTVSSEGAGGDGKRRITKPLRDNEFVYQLYFDISLALFARSGFGQDGYSAWEKKAPVKR
ncbi:hypothetical protein MX201_004038 [Salmonella enterica]|nr:hypothetical protein [Salmonella enterica]EGY4510555.1 hypothetical protein [Salmonella enterica]EGY4702748.1 hypothetical protein [Salmonella enterica]EHG4022271.1 hypothetical protein [Salmonella enterica]EHK3107684.1 hypothetical protein [Salmonella enterica]